jgi:hypothetical protein
MASSLLSESTKWLVARAKSSSTSLALTYPPSLVAMNAQQLGQSFMMCPIPLQRWHDVGGVAR